MMYAYRETRVMSADSLRELCINEDWYTCGTNEEYTKLLTSVSKNNNIDTDDLVEIAQNIVDHSNNIDLSVDGEFTNIMFKLARICNTFFEEV